MEDLTAFLEGMTGSFPQRESPTGELQPGIQSGGKGGATRQGENNQISDGECGMGKRPGQELDKPRSEH
jgi:hypothetical protein